MNKRETMAYISFCEYLLGIIEKYREEAVKEKELEQSEVLQLSLLDFNKTL